MNRLFMWMESKDKAIGLTDQQALSSIRLSIGYNIGQKEAAQVVKELKHFVH